MKLRKFRNSFARAAAVSLTVSLAGTASLAHAADITLIQIADIHGTLVPHSAVIHDADGTERYADAAGGLAKLATVINDIRDDNEDSLLVNVGDHTHGTAEALFTVGDAIMPAMNALGIDVSVPGNWDFGHGPAVFRSRFTPLPSNATTCFLPPNIRLMSDSEGVPCVTKATYPSVAINLFNNAADLPGAPGPLPSPPGIPFAAHHTPVLPPFKTFEVDGETVAVIGITAAMVQQMADVFSLGLEFTQGINELPAAIAQAKAAGADLIVVASELGLSQNIQIGRDFDAVDVVLSGHTHELTHEALVVSKTKIDTVPVGSGLTHGQKKSIAKGATIVVELSEDYYVGRLDLDVNNGTITDLEWNAIPADDSVAEDSTVKALADAQEAQFQAGPAFHPHVVMPAGYCGSPNPAQNPLGLDPCFVITPSGPQPNGPVTQERGLWLAEPLNKVVGSTNTLLTRHDDLETVWNNVIADALLDVTGSVAAVDISMTNGFRFGYDILSPNEGGSGDITLADLFSHFPISPALVVADFSGDIIERSLEVALDGVFNRNPYLQRGGWYLGLSSNMTQQIDLDNRPLSTSGERIVKTTINNAPLDPGKSYSFASCYPHGNPLDRVCRTPGGKNHQFFQLNNPFSYQSGISLAPPEPIFGPVIQGPNVQRIAPKAFLHPVHVLRLFLDSNGTIEESDFALGRVQTVNSLVMPPLPVPAPVSAINPDFVQIPEGAGPVLMPR